MYLYLFKISFFIIGLLSTQALEWNHSHEKYGSLLNSLINMNEERMKTINRLINLNDVNYKGLLRSIVRDQPEKLAVVIVSGKENSKRDEFILDKIEDNFIEPENYLRYKGSSDPESLFHKQPTINHPNDNIPIENARIRCVYVCGNVYRNVCRKLRTECSSKMRKYFRKECHDACQSF